MELLRANKITARFEGEGVIVGTFYKTHDKLKEIKSNDEQVIELGFVMPQSVDATVDGAEPVEVTPKQKLDAFKDFLQTNATAFGFTYDPIDRREHANKYPSTYTEDVLLETATKVLGDRLRELVTSVQKTVNSLIKSKHLPEGSELSCNVDMGTVSVGEKYKNGNLKYAEVNFPVVFGVGDSTVNEMVKIQLVSGQLKKPRELGEYAMTVTGLKTLLTEHNVLPVVEKKPKEADAGEVKEAEGEMTSNQPIQE